MDGAKDTNKANAIKMTDNPLENIKAMVPVLDEKAREAVSYVMYGCYLGEKIADKRNNDKSNERITKEASAPNADKKNDGT